jgi:membrane protein
MAAKKLLKPLLIGALATTFIGYTIKRIATGLSEPGAATQSSAVDHAVDDPSDLSKASWKKALLRTKNALKDKDLATSAAALSYYTTLAFFPTVIGLASCYILVASPHSLVSLIHQLHGAIPEALYTIIEKQITPIANTSQHKAGVAAIVSVLALIWTASGGLQNLVKATNKAYEVAESRKFLKLRGVSILLSFVVLVLGAFIVGLLVLQGTALQQFGLPHWAAVSFPILRWPLLVLLISLILSTIYRYAPNRSQPHWAWVSWGATAATIIWLVASVAFFVYVQNFGNYTKTYGTFAGIIILMVWLNISSLIVLLGAQVNKKLEEVAPTPTQT